LTLIRPQRFDESNKLYRADRRDIIGISVNSEKLLVLALLQERPGPLNYIYFNVMVFLLTYYKFEGKSSVSIVSSSVKHSDPVQVSDALQCSWNRSDTLWHISFHTSNFWCFRHEPLCCARVHVVVSI
jgi:hypothetical protein